MVCVQGKNPTDLAIGEGKSGEEKGGKGRERAKNSFEVSLSYKQKIYEELREREREKKISLESEDPILVTAWPLGRVVVVWKWSPIFQMQIMFLASHFYLGISPGS